MSVQKMGKKQKTTSVPDAVDAWLDKLLKDYEEPLKKLTITTKPKLYEALARHGEEPFVEMLRNYQKDKRTGQASPKQDEEK